MSTPPVCQECGRPLSKPEAACLACLLALGVDTRPTEPALETAPLGEQEGQLINRYRLLKVIGEGGFGTVWMARQEDPVRRQVALKILKAGMDTRQVVRRFEGERQALALMDHPNIARVFDGGATAAGRPYFVMELVHGVPITQFCDARKLTTDDRIALLIVVCHAIQHAHQKGVIHRDLKPSNILVAEQDGRPVPKVVDFGIAKAADARLTDRTVFTRFNQILGTPAYMSPEQAGWGGLDVDSRSDVYSLGVVLFEMLTGGTPFNTGKQMAEGLDGLLRTVRESEPPRPSAHLGMLSRPDLTAVAACRGESPECLSRRVKGELDWIVLKALAKDRNRRYETASAFAADLDRFMQAEPVSAAPPSAAYQLSKFASKHRKVIATLSAFMAVLIAGIVATTMQAARATRLAKSEAVQREAADRARAAQRDLLYASEMSVSYKALEAGQVQRVRRILEDQRPSLRAPDLRGWEWRYLWGMTRPCELRTLDPQPGYVSAVAYSPDGKRLALGYGGEGGVRLYDATDYRLLADQSTESGMIDTLAFTSNGDGIYVSLRSTHFLLLDSETLKTRFCFTGHQQPVCALAADANGDLLVSEAGNAFGQEGNAETFVWDARKRSVWFKLPASDSTGLLPRISTSGRYLSRGLNRRGAVEVWDLRERRRLAEFKAHRAITFATAISPDETLLATCGDDGAVRLWKWREHEEVARLGQHTAPAVDIAFSPDGRQLATCSLDSTVRLWDVAGLRERSVFRGHRGRIQRLAFSPDGQRIASAGGPDQSVRLWNTAFRAPDTLLDEATQSTAVAQFTPDGRDYCLLRVRDDGSSELKVWRAEPRTDGTHALISSFRSPDTLSMALSRSNLVLMAAGKTEVLVQDLISGRELGRMQSPLPLLGPITATPDGHWLAACALSNHVVVWNAETKATATVFLLPNASDNRLIAGRGSLLFSPDGTGLWVVFPGALDVACVDWRGQRFLTRLQGHTRAVLALASSPDGSIIATGSADMTARLWDAATGAPIAVLHGENGGVTSASFSPDGRTLATGCFDGPIRLWNVRARTELSTFQAHHSIVYSVLFSPDRNTLASASFDGTARIWHAPSAAMADLATRGGQSM